VHFSLNADVRLDDTEARRLSPVHVATRYRAPLVVAVGAGETSEFVRRTRILWDAWPGNRPPGAVTPPVIPARHRFRVVAGHVDAASELTRAMLALF
jgi:arylformamidase